MDLLKHLLSLFLIILSFSCLSEGKEPLCDTTSVSLGIKVDPVFDFGLILDETISKPGADFYEVFYLHWHPATKEVITIRVQEQLGFFRSNFILLWFNEELVFRQRLPLRGDEIETVAKNAVKQLNSKLLENLFIKTQLN